MSNRPQPQADMRPARPLLREIAALLPLDPPDGQALMAGQPFDFACGLRARFDVDDDADGADGAVRVVVILGIPAHAFAGDDVTRLLALQAALERDGHWRLGIGEEGLLELTSLQARDNPTEAAVDLHSGCLTAWMLLRVLLDEPLLEAQEMAAENAR